jgi:hypothetical protein
MPGGFDSLDPQLTSAARTLVAVASRAGLQPRLTSTLRSNAEQTRLYRRFLAGTAGYPVAPPGQSAHEYGLAFDMVVSPMDTLADLGALWKQWGGAWNGADAIHFELDGASEWARSQPSTLGPRNTIAEWFMAKYNAIPWWVSILLPASTMAQEATSENTSYLNRLIKKYGVDPFQS